MSVISKMATPVATGRVEYVYFRTLRLAWLLESETESETENEMGKNRMTRSEMQTFPLRAWCIPVYF